jgi:hypothetical protein
VALTCKNLWVVTYGQRWLLVMPSITTAPTVNITTDRSLSLIRWSWTKQTLHNGAFVLETFFSSNNTQYAHMCCCPWLMTIWQYEYGKLIFQSCLVKKTIGIYVLRNRAIFAGLSSLLDDPRLSTNPHRMLEEIENVSLNQQNMLDGRVTCSLLLARNFCSSSM